MFSRVLKVNWEELHPHFFFCASCARLLFPFFIETVFEASTADSSLWLLIAELSVLHLYYRLPETTHLKSLLCYSCALTVRDMVSDDVFDPFMHELWRPLFFFRHKKDFWTSFLNMYFSKTLGWTRCASASSTLTQIHGNSCPLQWGQGERGHWCFCVFIGVVASSSNTSNIITHTCDSDVVGHQCSERDDREQHTPCLVWTNQCEDLTSSLFVSFPVDSESPPSVHPVRGSEEAKEVGAVCFTLLWQRLHHS